MAVSLKKTNTGAMPHKGAVKLRASYLNLLLRRKLELSEILTKAVREMQFKYLPDAYWEHAGKNNNKITREHELNHRINTFKEKLEALIERKKGKPIADSDLVPFNRYSEGDRRATRGSQDDAEVSRVMKTIATEKFGMLGEIVPTNIKVQHGRVMPYELKIISKNGNDVIYETGVKNTDTDENIKLYGSLGRMIANLPDAIEAGHFKLDEKGKVLDEEWIGKRIVASAVIIWPTTEMPEHGFILIGLNQWTKQANRFIKQAKAENIAGGGEVKSTDLKRFTTGGATGVTLLIDNKGVPVTSNKQTPDIDKTLTRIGSSNHILTDFRDNTERKEAKNRGIQKQSASHRVK